MECDVVLKIGNDDMKIIKKESSPQELDSLQDVLRYLYDSYTKHELKLLKHMLDIARPNISEKDSFFNGKPIIGNCSLELLLYVFPEETELLQHIPKDRPYSITLIDKAYSNGRPFTGRIITATGKVSYVIRNKFDAERFAKNEYKKYLAELVILDDTITDQYLSDKYLEKLLKIRDKYKKRIEYITKDEDPNLKEDASFTIKYLILDYLNNSSVYSDYIKEDEKILDAGSILNDFCRELSYQEVINEDSESDMARSLRRLHYKRESIGKKDMYEVLTTYIPNFNLKYSEQEFINLSTEEMDTLLKECFEQDIILSKYVVEKAEETTKSEVTITKDQIKKLFDKVLKIKNEQRKAEGLPLISGDMSQVITSLEDAELFFKNNLFININDKQLPIFIRKRGKGLLYYYLDKKITNNDKIKLKRKGKSLQDELGFTQDTLQIFLPVNEEDVEDGKFEGFYIYKGTHPKLKQEVYLISKSVICPELYDPPKYSSLRDAKLAIQGFNRSANIEKATHIKIHQEVQSDTPKRYTQIKHIVNIGQTLDVPYFPIKSKTTLPALEYILFSKKTMADVVKYYKQFDIDLSSLTLPHLYGLFLYSMVEHSYSILNLLKTGVTLEMKDDIQNIINSILNAPTRQYLIERTNTNSYEKSDGTIKVTGHDIYLKDLTSAGRVINSAGVDVDGNTPKASLTASLQNLKTSLESTLFKGSDIHIEITNSDDLAQMKDNAGNLLFPNGVNEIRGFVHGDTIYLNLSRADVNDMLHETFHILLGAIKANNYNDYIAILKSLDGKVSKSIKDKVNGIYVNLAEEDKAEERVVRYLARVVENGNPFLYENQTDEVIPLIAKQFENLKTDVRKSLRKDFKSDLGFDTILHNLVLDNIPNIKRNRMLTNVIEAGISKGIITIKECK